MPGLVGVFRPLRLLPLVISLTAIPLIWHHSSANAETPDQVASESRVTFDALKKRAESGDAQAQGALGAMYFDGQGLPEDHRQAMIWNLKAAAQGRPEGFMRLGRAYNWRNANEAAEHGDPPPDYSRADAYFVQAYNTGLPLAAQGDITAKSVVGLMLLERRNHDRINDPLGFAYLQEAADAGDTTGILEVAEREYREHHPDKAIEWLLKAAAQGSTVAMYNLGIIYGEKHDAYNAVDWLNKAAVLGSTNASRTLLDLYNLHAGDPKLQYQQAENGNSDSAGQTVAGALILGAALISAVNAYDRAHPGVLHFTHRTWHPQYDCGPTDTPAEGGGCYRLTSD